jgi:hypothetical protein
MYCNAYKDKYIFHRIELSIITPQVNQNKTQLAPDRIGGARVMTGLPSRGQIFNQSIIQSPNPQGKIRHRTTRSLFRTEMHTLQARTAHQQQGTRIRGQPHSIPMRPIDYAPTGNGYPDLSCSEITSGD